MALLGWRVGGLAAMTLHDWEFALVADPSDASLFAYCDWLEEQGLCVETSRQARGLPGFWNSVCEERALAAWSDLSGSTGWQSALVVAHGVVNRLILAHMLSQRLWTIARLEQDAACINIIDLSETGAPLVRLINGTALNLGKVGMQLTTLEGLYRQYLRGR